MPPECLSLVCAYLCGEESCRIDYGAYRTQVYPKLLLLPGVYRKLKTDSLYLKIKMEVEFWKLWDERENCASDEHSMFEKRNCGGWSGTEELAETRNKRPRVDEEGQVNNKDQYWLQLPFQETKPNKLLVEPASVNHFPHKEGTTQPLSHFPHKEGATQPLSRIIGAKVNDTYQIGRQS